MPMSNCACKGCRACAGRCGTRVEKGKCPACLAEGRKTSDATRRHADRAERKRFYDSRWWRGMRKLVLYEEPFCQWVEDPTTARACMRRAEHVDHITPMGEPWHGDPYDRSNLQSLCQRHHAVKTAKEQRQRATLAADG